MASFAHGYSAGAAQESIAYNPHIYVQSNLMTIGTRLRGIRVLTELQQQTIAEVTGEQAPHPRLAQCALARLFGTHQNCDASAEIEWQTSFERTHAM